LFDGANMLSTIFNFQIYFIKLHEKVLQALIYAGTFFIFRVFTQGAEGQNTPNTNKHCTFRTPKIPPHATFREIYTPQSAPKRGRSTVHTYTHTHTMHTRVSGHERGRIRGGGGESTRHQVALAPPLSPSGYRPRARFPRRTPARNGRRARARGGLYTRAHALVYTRARTHTHTRGIPPPSRKRRFRAADARACTIHHPPRHTVIIIPTYACCYPSTSVSCPQITRVYDRTPSSPERCCQNLTKLKNAKGLVYVGLRAYFRTHSFRPYRISL
jgi:hypothetical protein